MTTAKKDSKRRSAANEPRPASGVAKKRPAKNETKAKPAKKAKTVKAEARASPETSPSKSRKQSPGGMPRKGKDPKGGLTAAGRKYFEEKEGLHLRPGVKGATDTPEKMLRKGSFLRRHFANPRGPVIDPKGKPTRQALQAAAWGEPVPKNEADEKRLANKGSELLEQYHEAKGDQPKEKVPADRSPTRGR